MITSSISTVLHSLPPSPTKKQPPILPLTDAELKKDDEKSSSRPGTPQAAMAMRLVKAEQKDIRWVEGLRGLAALFIVTSHLFAQSLFPALSSPTSNESINPSFFQFPFLRVSISGRSSLAFFFLLTGFANSLSFFKSIRAGNTYGALLGLSRSSFKRLGRLVLPAAVATAISWVLCQYGAYRLAKRADVGWFRDMSPAPARTWQAALRDLLRAIWSTWAQTKNPYDKVEWNLFFLLKASLLVYLGLLMSATATPRARKLLILAYYTFSWTCGDALIGMNIAAGVFLACLLHDTPSEAPAPLPSSPSSLRPSRSSSAWDLFHRFGPSIAIVLGLFFSSYPEKNPSWMKWSHLLEAWGRRIFMSSSEMDRDWSSVGALFIMLGTLYSPTAQWVLSNKILVWMGKVSFAVFLLHSTLIRSVLCWMLYHGKQPQKIRKDDGMLAFGFLEHRTGAAMWAAIAVFFATLYACAWVWYLYVETWCGKMCQSLEDEMFEKDSTRSTRNDLPR